MQRPLSAPGKVRQQLMHGRHGADAYRLAYVKALRTRLRKAPPKDKAKLRVLDYLNAYCHEDSCIRDQLRREARNEPMLHRRLPSAPFFP